MSSTERVNEAIAALQVVDDAIFKSSQQKYYHSIRDYDGISESNLRTVIIGSPKYLIPDLIEGRVKRTIFRVR